eukprot:CAMPEP_0170583880 /NCGR_PEP_ID=MMETSP0224-20130122/8383_1 /TAXON_ID=285029 /ORGANISM="Togula jolla, Strain CCCM 725" /LENGTH=483 /DNA_ID=CAMNT_0010907261 /DNA_START=79 /DNA_END=1526 /DNA_ORIENTATION=-
MKGTGAKIFDLEGASDKRIRISDVVESLGFGPFQVSMFFLTSAATNFCDGLEIVVLNSISVATAAEFDISPVHRGMLSTMVFLGFCAGCFTSGCTGDGFGRRLPIVTGLGLMSFCSAATGLCDSFSAVVAYRTAMGFFMGLAYTPALAVVSELTPTNSRMLMRVVGHIAFALGAGSAGLLLSTEDPTLQSLAWRRLAMIVAVPPLMWTMFSASLMPESPVFLASTGDRPGALRGFAAMKALNRATNAVIDFAPAHPSTSGDGSPGPLAVCFSRRFRMIIVVATYVLLCANLVKYGHNYAAPQIFPQTSLIPAAWNLTIMQGWSVLTGVATLVASRRLSRASLMTAGLLITSSALLAFVVAASYPTEDASWTAAAWGFYGRNFIQVGADVNFITVVQVAVEGFPTVASATGAGIILGASRLGAAFSPVMFEKLRVVTGSWSSYYELMLAMNIFGVVLMVLFRRSFNGLEGAYEGDRSTESLVLR